MTYDTTARIEHRLNDAEIPASVDLGGDWITADYAAVDTIQRHKQAAHYDQFTNIGAGLDQALHLLNNHKREGSRQTILLMTDGNANRSGGGWSVPNGWDWDELTDYNGDGRADYETSDWHKLYAFVKAKEAIDQGVVIHTLSVGANADRDLMKAIAFAGGGEWIDVPGGSSIAEMQQQCLVAFSKIAARVPPPKLVYED